jgi:hypothetical protein
LKQKEGLKCKLEGLGADLQIELKNQGPRCKICKDLDCGLILEKMRVLCAKVTGISIIKELFF